MTYPLLVMSFFLYGILGGVVGIIFEDHIRTGWRFYLPSEDKRLMSYILWPVLLVVWTSLTLTMVLKPWFTGIPRVTELPKAKARYR